MRERILWLAALLVTLLLYAANLWFGELNQDEGWYLYASQLVASGKLPYLHFASTQGPVMSFGYVPACPLVAKWGLAGGRAYTALLGLFTLLISGRLACGVTGGGRRGRLAALVVFCLLGVNVYHTYFTTVVKTYALSGFLLTLGFLVLASALRKRSAGMMLLSAVLMVLSAGTRTSAAFAVPVVFAGLLWMALRARERVVPLQLPIWYALGAALAGCVVFLPFLLAAPRAMWFGLVEYHAAREGGTGLVALAYKGGFISRVVAAYLPGVMLAMGLVLYRWAGGAGSKRDSADAEHSLMWWLLVASVGVVTLVHILAPFPYDDYQVIVYPLFAVAVAVKLCGCLTDASGEVADRRRLALGAGVLALCLAVAGSSPITWGWFVGERDRIWWPLKEQSPLADLREAGRIVREQSEPGDELLTQDTYLAVEARRRVPAGLELGPFSYYPEWDDEQAAACHVLNRVGMRRLLQETGASLAAFSGYGLAVQCPEVIPLSDEAQAELRQIVNARYDLIKTIPQFGQAYTDLELLKLK